MNFYPKNTTKTTQTNTKQAEITNFIFGLKSLINTHFIYFADRLLQILMRSP